MFANNTTKKSILLRRKSISVDLKSLRNIMDKWYIYFNIGLVVLLVWFLVTKALPREKSDIQKVDKHYQRIKQNPQCLDYLQTVNAIPTWRFSLLNSAIFTTIELILYIVAGGTFDKPLHFLMFWILYLLNFLFIYKMIATRSWHYMCSDGCVRDLDSNEVQ
ncbi:hypothetical protein LCGC14_2588860 [marine sediment metagenome]|uniref:Uncharacterized protein n=1 Tax=marine sediment metagenome TaxID=412755 RepID=A0A0F9AC62_9ZZZZ